MAILYKHFAGLRTALYAVFVVIALAIVGMNTAHADSTLFTVDNIRVDVTAKNAAKAREEAFNQAQFKAFETLAARMVKDSENAFEEGLELSVISSLIKDFEVTKEKISNVRYVGTYVFRFKDKEVRAFFSEQGLGYTDVSSRPVLLLPFYQEADTIRLWGQGNPWLSAWGRAQNLEGLVPVIVPVGDISDVSDIADKDALSYDEARLKRMTERYDAGEAVLLVAVWQPGEVVQSEAVSLGTLYVQIYRTDRRGPEFVQTLDIQMRRDEAPEELLDRAVNIVYTQLQRDWKEKTLVSAEQGNRLQVKIGFKSLTEWAATQKALSGVYGVNDIVLVSLTPSQARVDLVFQGSEKRLRLALAQANMTLSKPRIDIRNLQSGFGGLPLVYELYLNSLRRG